MANGITLKWDDSRLGALQGTSAERAMFRALRKAGSGAIKAAKAESNRQIRANKKFKVSRVNKALSLQAPRGATSIEQLAWVMRVKVLPVPLVEFPNRQGRKGVTATVNAGKPVLLKSAFRATMRSGHVGIFRRLGKARLGIKELYSTRVRDVFDDAGMLPAVWERAQTVFARDYARLLPLELAK